MAGQGYYISDLAHQGGSLWLGDLNPGPLLLAILRDPRFLVESDRLRAHIKKKAGRLKNKRRRTDSRLGYTDDWFTIATREELEQYKHIFGLSRLGNLNENEFWQSCVSLIFSACLPILAARELACFHESDNLTWPKPGGLQRYSGIYEPLMRALDAWCEYAFQMSRTRISMGSLNVSLMDAEYGNFGLAPSPDAIVTSPPYANRLDYTRMWAPELEIASILFKTNVESVKGKQIGSTVIRNKEVDEEVKSQLPDVIVEALHEIRLDKENKASGSYYYPFFLNYSISLMQCLGQIAQKLKPGGKLIIFVRDTVRKDILFPSGLLIEKVLERRGDFKLIPELRKQRIIRHHIGMLRKDKSKAGVYGMAQREWWLVFQKQN